MDKKEIWYLDYAEEGYPWHFDLEKIPENADWKNIGYGEREVLIVFCHVVDAVMEELKIKLTTEQVIRLAKKTPGITVFKPDEDKKQD